MTKDELSATSAALEPIVAKLRAQGKTDEEIERHIVELMVTPCPRCGLLTGGPGAVHNCEAA